MTIAKLIDPTFNVKERVVFEADKFMELLNSGKLNRGSVIIFDEAGVGIPAREWYSISNKMLNYVMQTFRNLNLGVIFTTPSFDYIDVGTRKLFHSYIETLAIDYKRELVITKWLEVQYNPQIGKLYFKYPRIRDEKGSIVKITRFLIHKPSQDLIDAYENKKKNFTNKLNTSVGKELNRLEKVKEIKVVDVDDIVKECLENKEEYVENKAGEPFVDSIKIMNKFGVGRLRAMKSKRRIEEALKEATHT